VSGGRWGYQSYNIQNTGERAARFIKAIADSEHIIDWAECGDTVRRREDGSGAERDLYDLWLKTFDEVFG
jgi:hypothetical protein